MTFEENLFIYAREYWICRGGTGSPSDHVVKGPKDHEYYKIDEREIRYTIRGVSGNHQDPASIYASPISHDCPAASTVINPTRRYIREFDRTYFKFYDDAEEILNNIISFTAWIRKKKTTIKTTAAMNKFNLLYENMLRNVASSPTWEAEKASMIGFDVKRRSDLVGLVAYNQEELDIAPSR